MGGGGGTAGQQAGLPQEASRSRGLAELLSEAAQLDFLLKLTAGVSMDTPQLRPGGGMEAATRNGDPPPPRQAAWQAVGGQLEASCAALLGTRWLPPLPQEMGLLHNPPNLLFLLNLMAAERQGDRGKNMRRDFPNPYFLSRQQENSWGLNIWEI